MDDLIKYKVSLRDLRTAKRALDDWAYFTRDIVTQSDRDLASEIYNMLCRLQNRTYKRKPNVEEVSDD